jgi:hypothetical protein
MPQRHGIEDDDLQSRDRQDVDCGKWVWGYRYWPGVIVMAEGICTHSLHTSL